MRRGKRHEPLVPLPIGLDADAAAAPNQHLRAAFPPPTPGERRTTWWPGRSVHGVSGASGRQGRPARPGPHGGSHVRNPLEVLLGSSGRLPLPCVPASTGPQDPPARPGDRLRSGPVTGVSSRSGAGIAPVAPFRLVPGRTCLGLGVAPAEDPVEPGAEEATDRGGPGRVASGDDDSGHADLLGDVRGPVVPATIRFSRGRPSPTRPRRRCRCCEVGTRR